MKKLFLLVASLTLVFGWAQTSSAEVIQFDTNGAAAGGVVTVDDFDWVPGNSMIMEDYGTLPSGFPDLTAPSLVVIGPNTFQTATVLFQANLNTMTLGGVPQYVNGVGGDFFTVVAAVDVLVLQTPLVGGGFASTGQFFLVPDSGVFKIYADPTDRGDDLSGLGFTNGVLDPDGHAILSGTSFAGSGSVITQQGSYANPALTDPISNSCEATNDDVNGYIQCLDQHDPTNSYVNFYTLLANGGGSFIVDFKAISDFIDTTYFLNLDQDIAFAFTGTASNLPFRDVDPSAQFSADAIANGGTPGAGTLAICGPGADNTFGTGDDEAGTAASPCINGHGINIMAQTDAHTSFQGLVASEVPEPATLALLGFGLLGSAAARRRQLRNKR